MCGCTKENDESCLSVKNIENKQKMYLLDFYEYYQQILTKISLN